MGRIHVLDDAVINKIAAGEVVERPASVVKEMVENALDAGATAVTVTLAQGGLSSIVVSDNGTGMDREDAYLALKRHATSKIAVADDLFSIETMGFRGEALASIASVSRFSLSTIQAGQTLGIKLEAAGGTDVQEFPWSGSQGTIMCANDLFFNVPARAKFLKAPATELSYSVELMQAFALCHPQVSFTLIHNGKEVLRAPTIATGELSQGQPPLKGEAHLRERAKTVFGGEAQGLMYVTAESRYGSVEALISAPGVEKASGKYVFTFVNGRWVKDKTLRYGILRGYHSHLLKGRFPIALMHLTMDPALVDVNAHPAKTEVRFQYPSEVQNLLAMAIREKIRSGSWAAPEAASSPTKAEGMAPKASFKPLDDDGALRTWQDAEATLDGAVAEQDPPGRSPSSPAGWPSPSSRREEDRQRTTQKSASFGQVEARPLPWDRNPPAWGTLSSRSAPPLAPIVDKASLDALLKGAPAPLEEGPARIDVAPIEPHFVATAPKDYQRVASPIPWDELEYVGVFDRCFLLFEGRERLLVVDQHAFHERILFEQLMADASLLSQCQRLLVPEALDLSPTDVALLLEHKDPLADRGFEFRDEGAGGLVVYAVPSLLAGRDLGALFSDLARGLKAEPGGEEPGDSNGELARLILATSACHAAVKAGEELPPDTLRRLLIDARKVDFVENCPHGRRVFRWWTRSQVASWFDR